MAFTGSNAPNGLGNSPVNNSSKAWYQAGNDSYTSRTSLRQDAQAPSQKGRQQGGLHWPSWVTLSPQCIPVFLCTHSELLLLAGQLRLLCCPLYPSAYQLAPA